MRIPQVFRLSSFLLLILLITPFLFNFQPEEYAIPPQIKSLLDRAEIKRCQFDFDSTVILMKEAQAAYKEMGKEQEAVALYGRILYIFPESEAADITNNLSLLEEAQAALDKLNPKNKTQIQHQLDLCRLRYMWIHEQPLEELASLSEKLEKELDPEKDWDLLAGLYTELTAAYSYTYYEAADVSEKIENYTIKAMQLIDKNLKEHHKEKAHLYYYYPYYLYYTYSNEGSRLSFEGNYEAALLAYQQTLTKVLDQQIFLDSLLYSTTYNSIAFLYQIKSDFDKSREYYERALLYTAERFPHAFAIYYNNIAEGYLTQAKDADAVHYFKKAIAFNNLKEADEDKNYLLFGIYRGMATAYIKLDQFDNALASLQNLEKLPKEEDPLPAWTLATWGFYYQHTGDFKKSLVYHEKSLEEYGAYSSQRSSGYWNIGQIAIDQKEYTRALEYFQKSLIINIPAFKSTAVLDNPKYDDIIDKHNTINPLIDKLNAMRHLSKEKDDLATYGESMLELSNLTLRLFEETRNSFERESSKRDLLQAAYTIYEQTIGLYLDLYAQDKNPEYLKTAFELSERSKSVLLMDALKESNALSFAGIPDSLVNREVELTNNIAFYEQQTYYAQRKKNTDQIQLYKKNLLDAKEELDALKTRLEKDYTNYYQLKYKTSQISLTNILQAIPEDLAMIEYFEGRDELYVFILFDGKLTHYRFLNDKDYQSNINNLYSNLTDMSTIVKNEAKALQELKESSYHFYKKYVGPYLPKSAKKLILIPDGKLSYIPFEALLTEDKSDDQAHFNNLPYLLKDYSVSYHYAASLWLEQLSRKPSSKALKLLAMAASYEEIKANDEFTTERVRSVRDGLLPIPGTIEEINGLQAKFGGTFQSAKTADEHSFKKNAANFGIIHLAMHGIVDSRQPEYSGLVFTDNPKNTEDDLLHAYEIKSMKLQAELVVLSACETGYGKYQHGEGVASLGRGFMYAGVPSVVMTLWKLHDQSSILLIASFYDQLAQGLPKDEALRQAKLNYLKINSGATAHPAFWAAFIQLGDNRPLVLAKSSAGIWPSGSTGWGLGIGVAALALVAGAFAMRRTKIG